MKDLRFAARRLRHSPGFAFTALLVLAIGIGLNTAIFSIVDGLLFRPLPFAQPERVVRVAEYLKSFGEVGASYPDFLDWQREAKTLASSSVLRSAFYTLADRTSAERVPVVEVSHSFFDVIGVQPALGRGFLADEDHKAAPLRAVITDQFWRQRFHHDPAVIGRTLNLQGSAFTIVGVMPASFYFPFVKCEALVAAGPAADYDRGDHSGGTIARLKPGVTREQATAELQTIAHSISTQYPDKESGLSMQALPVREFFVHDYQPVMLTMLAGVAVVLLIACVNLAGLMLVRATGRGRELALRKALGASSWALLREHLSEAVILAVGGGALGILAGGWCLKALLALIPDTLTLPPIALDTRVLLFAVGTTTIAALLFGLAPALRTLSADPIEALKEGGRSNTAGLSGNRLRGALVVAEISLALVLALGAGLITKSFSKLVHVDPGFRPAQTLTMRVALTGPRYEQPQWGVFWTQFLKAAAQQPSLRSLGMVSFLPLSDYDNESGYLVEGAPAHTAAETAFADTFIIGGEYFKTLGIPLVKGRSFRPTDNQQSTRVVIVDEDFVRKNFPHSDPLIHRVRWDDKLWQIVGVTGHVQAFGLQGEQKREQFYFPVEQYARPDMTLVVQPGNSAAAGAVRKVVRSLDPGVPVYSIRPLEDFVNDHTWAARLGTLLLALFAGVALILAGIGIYGVMAYSVAQRTPEIGIRLALGATPSGVLNLILRQAAMLCGLGIVIGAVTAIPVLGFLKSVLFEVSTTDAGVFTAGAVVLALVGLAAGAIPALRAARTDPMQAMRYE